MIGLRPCRAGGLVGRLRRAGLRRRGRTTRGLPETRRLKELFERHIKAETGHCPPWECITLYVYGRFRR